MQEQTSPIPPIYGFIAQPNMIRGQTVYVAIGEPVLMPMQTPQGQIYVVQNIQKTPVPDTRNTSQNKDHSVTGALSSIGDAITQASGVISEKISKTWESLFK